MLQGRTGARSTRPTRAQPLRDCIWSTVILRGA